MRIAAGRRLGPRPLCAAVKAAFRSLRPGVRAVRR
jgi:hypothetical protein